eukprot:COSAG02_NODE_1354_length_13100_cov_7.477040_5_plen_65_part_00
MADTYVGSSADKSHRAPHTNGLTTRAKASTDAPSPCMRPCCEGDVKSETIEGSVTASCRPRTIE